MNQRRMSCESCGMPVESGPYCPYCLDERGELQTFEERLRRMKIFISGRNPAKSDIWVEAEAKEKMALMPAWRNHEELRQQR